MQVNIYPDEQTTGINAAKHGASLIRQALVNKGEANIIVATGTSQFHMLERLVVEPNIEWDKVTIFHLDEYIGISDQHPASFRLYLQQRVVNKLPSIKHIEFVNGSADNIEQELSRLSNLISATEIDVAFVGIGENGHLAFNDPPADFNTDKPYLNVKLDEACRKQQLGEGWFENLQSVPSNAISMSIPQILKSHHIVCTVPSDRKAKAVKMCLQEVDAMHPASILQRHDSTFLYLDEDAASLLEKDGSQR